MVNSWFASLDWYKQGFFLSVTIDLKPLAEKRGNRLEFIQTHPFNWIKTLWHDKVILNIDTSRQVRILWSICIAYHILIYLIHVFTIILKYFRMTPHQKILFMSLIFIAQVTVISSANLSESSSVINITKDSLADFALQNKSAFLLFSSDR